MCIYIICIAAEAPTQAGSRRCIHKISRSALRGRFTMVATVSRTPTSRSSFANPIPKRLPEIAIKQPTPQTPSHDVLRPTMS